MRRISQDKRALSEVISYVLLILVAFAMATLVYVWMNGFVGDPTPTCESGVSFNLKKVECSGGQIKLTISNQGTFYINGFMVKVSEDGKDIMPAFILESSDAAFASTTNGKNILGAPLKTGDEATYTFDYNIVGFTGPPEKVSVQAIITQTNEKTGKIEPILCEETVITQDAC
jgi:FlaG/FlaF family flagellin (archaellin)